jgi:hypothetical protein
MMRQRLGILAFPILAFAAACGPPPVGPRPALDPPPDPAPVDPAADADVTPLPGAQTLNWPTRLGSRLVWLVGVEGIEPSTSTV